MPIVATAAFSSVGFAVSPVKAFTIIDGMGTPTTDLTTNLATNNPSTPPTTGADILGTRIVTLDTANNGIAAVNFTANPFFDDGVTATSSDFGSGVRGTTTYSYNFGNGVDLTSGGTNDRFQVGILNTDATPALPVTFTFTVFDAESNTSTSAPPVVFTTAVSYPTDPAATIVVPFSSFGTFDFTDVEGFTLTVASTSSRDVSIDYIAAAVPVPPAFLGTILGGVVAALRGLKKKSEASV